MVFRFRSCMVPALILLGAWICPVSFAQTNAAKATPGSVVGSLTQEQQVEMQQKLGAATAAARKDPQVEAAFQRAIKALRESDEAMYKKIKQIDPSLTEFVDQILKAKYPDFGK
jgi:hypothetical protein